MQSFMFILKNKTTVLRTLKAWISYVFFLSLVCFLKYIVYDLYQNTGSYIDFIQGLWLIQLQSCYLGSLNFLKYLAKSGEKVK